MIRTLIPTAVLLAAVGFFVTACKQSELDKELYHGPVSCLDSNEPGIGSWTPVLHPPEILSLAGNPGAYVSDGDDFMLVEYNYLTVLRNDNTWAIQETDTFKRATDNYVATPEYVFVQGGYDANYVRVFTHELGVLDRATAEWSYPGAPPDERSSYVSAVWTGSEYFLWGGYENHPVPVSRNPDPVILHLDGAMFDPTTSTWRKIPAAPLAPMQASRIRAIWTSRGLFVFGPPHTMLFDSETETWAELAPGPNVNKWPTLIEGDGEVFVIHGYDEMREMWRYSFEENSWTQEPLPAWVDPARGTWLDGKLYTFGICQHGAMFIPKTGEWVPLAPIALEGAYGQAVVAGGRIIYADVMGHYDTYPYAFVFEPPGYEAMGIGGAGGATQ